MRLADLLARTDMVPAAYKGKPENTCVAIMQGLEVGLLPLAALASIAIINGRPSLWGDGALAVVQHTGLMESFEEADDGTTATCIIKRRGNPKLIVRRFSMEDAKRAGLAGKAGPWTQYPQRMRQMRARSWALRDGFSDALKGLCIGEEAQDIPVRDITPRAAAIAPPDIPDMPKAPPPDVPDVPHDPETGEIATTDAEYLADLDGAFATAATEARLAEHIEANKATVEERGLEQAANDLAMRHLARLEKAATKPAKTPEQAAAEEEYARLFRALRMAATVAMLAALWKHEHASIKALPANWQAELAAEKDRLKVRLAQSEGAAA
jgi:hypothetical protein